MQNREDIPKGVVWSGELEELWRQDPSKQTKFTFAGLEILSTETVYRSNMQHFADYLLGTDSKGKSRLDVFSGSDRIYFEEMAQRIRDIATQSPFAALDEQYKATESLHNTLRSTREALKKAEAEAKNAVDNPKLQEQVALLKANLTTQQKALNLALKNLYDGMQQVLSSKAYQDYIKQHEEFIVRYDGYRSFVSAAVSRNQKAAQMFEEFRQDPRSASLNVPSFLIMPVQRVPRYPLLFKALQDEAKGRKPEPKIESPPNEEAKGKMPEPEKKPPPLIIDTPESNAVSNLMETIKDLTANINKRQSTSPYAQIDIAKIESMLNLLEKELQKQNNNFSPATLQIALEKIQALKAVYAEIKLPSTGYNAESKRDLVNDRTIEAYKNKMADLNAKIKELESKNVKAESIRQLLNSTLTPYEQLLFHTQNYLAENPEDAQALKIQEILLRLVTHEAQYKAVQIALNIAGQLPDVDFAQMLPENRIIRNLQELSNVIEAKLDQSDKDLSTELASFPNLAAYVRLKELASVTDDLSKTQTTRSSKQPTITFSTTQTQTPTVDLNTIVLDPTKRSTQVKSMTETTKVEPKTAPKEKQDLFSRSLAKESREKIKTDAVILVKGASDRVVAMNLIPRIQEQLSANQKRVAGLHEELRGITATPYIAKTWQELTVRNDVGEVAKRAGSLLDKPEAKQTLDQFQQALNRTIQLQDQLALLIRLSGKIEEYEKQALEARRPFAEIFNSSTKKGRAELASYMTALVPSNAQDLQALQRALREQQASLQVQIEQSKAEAQRLERAVKVVERQYLEQNIIDNLAAKIADNNSVFNNLKAQVRDATRKPPQPVDLIILAKQENYVGVLARKWGEAPANNMTPKHQKLIASLNRALILRQEISRLEGQERMLQEFRTQKEALLTQLHDSDFQSSFDAKNKRKLSRLDVLFVDKDSTELAKMQKSIAQQKEKLEREIRHELQSVQTFDSDLTNIRRKNATKSGMPYETQIKNLTAVIKLELEELRIRLQYQIKRLPDSSKKRALLANLDKVDYILRDGKALFDEPSINNLHVLKSLIDSQNLKESYDTRPFAKGFSESYEQLKSNAAQALKSLDKKMNSLDYVKPEKTKGISHTQHIFAKFKAVEKFCEDMLKILEERKAFVKGDEARRNTELYNTYKQILEATQKARNQFSVTHPNGTVSFRYSKEALENLGTLTRMPHLQVNEDVRDVLKGVDKDIKREMTARQQSVAHQVAVSPKVHQEAKEVEERITSSREQKSRNKLFDQERKEPEKPKDVARSWLKRCH